MQGRPIRFGATPDWLHSSGALLEYLAAVCCVHLPAQHKSSVLVRMQSRCSSLIEDAVLSLLHRRYKHVLVQRTRSSAPEAASVSWRAKLDASGKSGEGGGFLLSSYRHHGLSDRLPLWLENVSRRRKKISISVKDEDIQGPLLVCKTMHPIFPPCLIFILKRGKEWKICRRLLH